MLRQQLNDALKAAMKAQDKRRVSTLRLILAALKDRDIAARSGDNGDGISETDILGMLQTMIRQRQDSTEQFKQGGRKDLADKEQEEIAVIQDFLPDQLDEGEVGEACREVVAELEAGSLKDMGRVMGELKSRYTGRMDFSKASAAVKELLS
ncbi:MAG: GatB/YqeY domain-containing protein [Alphaproteobacteria bacterium]|nr:GatB/YqeY domain-containing protein [Alphaproteobacteria bacterium]